MAARVVGPVGFGVLVLVGGLATAAGWVDEVEVARWVGRHAGWLVVFGLAGVLVAMGVARAVRQPDHRWVAPALSWWVVAAAAGVVVWGAWGATTWLLREADRAQDPAAARVEAIKTGLTIGAGTAGVFALLAVRRQWHQERSSAATEHDAAERRVTELYSTAVEQLGSEQAAVRLGGLYALERVAQNNPDQRQTIVNVLCAYLRMPYSLPNDQPDGPADQDRAAARTERVQEREVRLTAQRVLTTHLQPGDGANPADTFWADTDLDLTGAVLINFELALCHLRIARFTHATFAGDATFTGTEFASYALFNKAQFANHALFNEAQFANHALFNEAEFANSALFDGAKFAGDVWFARTEFAGDLSFARTEFAGNASFGKAMFAGFAWFGEARFASYTLFAGAEFASTASFAGATFTDHASFDSATFTYGVPTEVERFQSPPGEN